MGTIRAQRDVSLAIKRIGFNDDIFCGCSCIDGSADVPGGMLYVWLFEVGIIGHISLMYPSKLFPPTKCSPCGRT